MNRTFDDLQNEFWILGHRGAAGLDPENTLPSFDSALSLGCAGIELDVHCIVDGKGSSQLCIIHDDSVNRTTNGKGLVADFTATQITELDAGNGAGVPLLEEVMDLVIAHQQLSMGSGVLVNIELKGKGTAQPVAHFLSTHSDLSVLVSSFDHDQLRNFRHLDSSTPVAPLFARPHANMIAIADELGASYINLSRRLANQSTVEECRAAGYGVWVYTVNQIKEAKTMKALGVTGIFTDRPDLMLDLQIIANEGG